MAVDSDQEYLSRETSLSAGFPVTAGAFPNYIYQTRIRTAGTCTWSFVPLKTQIIAQQRLRHISQGSQAGIRVAGLALDSSRDNNLLLEIPPRWASRQLRAFSDYISCC